MRLLAALSACQRKAKGRKLMCKVTRFAWSFLIGLYGFCNRCELLSASSISSSPHSLGFCLTSPSSLSCSFQDLKQALLRPAKQRGEFRSKFLAPSNNGPTNNAIRAFCHRLRKRCHVTNGGLHTIPKHCRRSNRTRLGRGQFRIRRRRQYIFRLLDRAAIFDDKFLSPALVRQSRITLNSHSIF
jgi:hypothetical protein